MEEMGKDFCSNLLQAFLETIDRRSCNDGSRELIPVFHNPRRICQPPSLEVARTLENLVGTITELFQPPHNSVIPTDTESVEKG